MPGTADDPEYQTRLAAFTERLGQLGWVDGQTIHVDIRWSGADSDRRRKFATEIVTLAPDVILAPGSSSMGPLLQATHTIPVVFATTADPVGAGFVESLSRPGGNATGFTAYDYSIGGKWLELLKEISPGVTRVAVIRDPITAAGVGQLAAIQAVAQSLRVEPRGTSRLPDTNILDVSIKKSFRFGRYRLAIAWIVTSTTMNASWRR